MKRISGFVVVLSVFFHLAAEAQDAAPTPAFTTSSTTITGEGISGELDKERRSPTVSISVSNNTVGTKLLVDAYIADPEFKDYPIQFDFYVNRQFYTSQIRSAELPGPIGIDIPASAAQTPFNYSVIAKTLHPNRVFTTIVNGAVFSSNLSATFDCTLTTGINSEDSKEYIANDTLLSQSGNSSLSINFETESTPSGHDITASSTLTVSGTTATGTLTIAEDDGDPRSVEVSGTAEMLDTSLTSINVTSADGNVSLSYS